MQKHIKAQKQKMWLIMVLLALLCVWQSKFVWMAIDSNIYMNGTIIVAFLASCVYAFYQVSTLKKDVTALHALQEMWDDVRASEREGATNPFWRHYRALKPGTVFERPKILGHVYDLVLDEIARTGRMAISVGSMSTLMHKIDAKLAEERSLLNYMSGLLVFMGLIGAFLGLLKMVGSIGGILGGLSSAGGGGGSNADAFNKLLTDLQAPLGGMATGFASSLFGLFGSLVIGLLARFSNDAATTIKHEFENWLAGVAQIETKNEEADQHESATSRTVSTIDPGIARAISGAMEQSNRTLARSADQFAGLVEEQGRQSESLSKIASHVETVANRQVDLQAQVGLIQSLGATLGELRNEVARMERGLEARLNNGIAEIGSLVAQIANNQAEQIHRLTLQQGDLTQSVNALARHTSGAGIAEMHAGMVEGFGRMSKVLDASNRAVAHGLIQVAQTQTAISGKMAAAPASGASADLSALVERMDRNMAQGLTQISQSIEEVFIAYARNLKAAEQARSEEPANAFAGAPVETTVEPTRAKTREADKAALLNRFYEVARESYLESKAKVQSSAR